jgi:hypothetical protein
VGGLLTGAAVGALWAALAYYAVVSGTEPFADAHARPVYFFGFYFAWGVGLATIGALLLPWAHSRAVGFALGVVFYAVLMSGLNMLLGEFDTFGWLLVVLGGIGGGIGGMIAFPRYFGVAPVSTQSSDTPMGPSGK